MNATTRDIAATRLRHRVRRLVERMDAHVVVPESVAERAARVIDEDRARAEASPAAVELASAVRTALDHIAVPPLLKRHRAARIDGTHHPAPALRSGIARGRGRPSID